jgi:uncharacterized membrane protein
MTGTLFRAVSIVSAAMTMGLAAGVFALYAHTIMPGLHKTDDRTFVGAFQSIDRAIVNPWFMSTAFVGALFFTTAAAISHRGTPAMRWVIAALALYLIAVVITIAVNVPLNDAIKAAGDPARIDAAEVRAKFDETRWAAWNLIRVATTTAASGLLTWAIVLYGRQRAWFTTCLGTRPAGARALAHTGAPGTSVAW